MSQPITYEALAAVVPRALGSGFTARSYRRGNFGRVFVRDNGVDVGEFILGPDESIRLLSYPRAGADFEANALRKIRAALAEPQEKTPL
jgi:hypothetical protein